jgi:STAS-like domain of unknown function (DUF4325)
LDWPTRSPEATDPNDTVHVKKHMDIAPTAGAFAEDKDFARKLRTLEILPALAEGSELVLDFGRVKYVTQSFVHALVGEALVRYGADLLERVEFKNCSPQIRSVVSLVVDYSLGGFANGEPELVEARRNPSRTKRRTG